MAMYENGVYIFCYFQISSKSTVKMLCSDDEEDPRGLAISHIKLLIEKCSSLSKMAMQVDSPNAAEDVMNAGSDCNIFVTLYS